MSYILEALKKSQQERELGRVPTLDKLPFPAEAAQARPGPWIMAAVGLAMLAVIIALYSAMRGQSGVADAERVPEHRGVSVEAPSKDAKEISAVSESVPADAPSVPEDRGVTEKPDASLKEPLPVDDEPPAPPVTVPDAAPARKSAPSVGVQQGGRDAAVPKRPEVSKIPEDLRQDIEAFKDEVRRERAGSKPKSKPKAKEKAPEPRVPPQQLKLPSDVRVRLPAFLMTVHVYDKDPAKRFVSINALKVREKERSREGITVEEILPDGAVLSYEGHRFFQER